MLLLVFQVEPEECDGEGQDGECSSTVPTVYTDVMMTNKEKLFEEAFQQFKSPWIEHNFFDITFKFIVS